MKKNTWAASLFEFILVAKQFPYNTFQNTSNKSCIEIRCCLCLFNHPILPADLSLNWSCIPYYTQI